MIWNVIEEFKIIIEVIENREFYSNAEKDDKLGTDVMRL